MTEQASKKQWWDYEKSPFNPAESVKKAENVAAETSRSVEDRMRELVTGPNLAQALIFLAAEIDALKARK